MKGSLDAAKRRKIATTRGAGRVTAAIGMVLAMVLAGAGIAVAADLMPHQAFYTLHLKSTVPGSTLTDVTGAMYIDWVESCEGWSSSQRLELRFFDAEKPTVEIDSRFASWESRDGLSYRFTVANIRNGAPDKELNGKATLQGPGQAGEAEFIGAHPIKMALAAGTIFPVRHMIELIDHAAAGDKIVARSVFDGTTEDGPLDINAVIGPLKKAVADDPIIPKSVNRAYRPMRLAFFNPKDNDVTPFYELSTNLMDNGIARDFLLDYGDSVIAATLQRIELLDKPKC